MVEVEVAVQLLYRYLYKKLHTLLPSLQAFFFGVEKKALQFLYPLFFEGKAVG
jgi:hypothetical protein